MTITSIVSSFVFANDVDNREIYVATCIGHLLENTLLRTCDTNDVPFGLCHTYNHLKQKCQLNIRRNVRVEAAIFLLA